MLSAVFLCYCVRDCLILCCLGVGGEGGGNTLRAATGYGAGWQAALGQGNLTHSRQRQATELVDQNSVHVDAWYGNA